MKNVPVSSSFINIFSPNSGIKYGPTYYIFSKMRQPRVKDRIATKSSFSKKKKKKIYRKTHFVVRKYDENIEFVAKMHIL